MMSATGNHESEEARRTLTQFMKDKHVGRMDVEQVIPGVGNIALRRTKLEGGDPAVRRYRDFPPADGALT